jgi:hypothetical protein
MRRHAAAHRRRGRGLAALALTLGVIAPSAIAAPAASAAPISQVFTGMASPAVTCAVQTAAATRGQR